MDRYWLAQIKSKYPVDSGYSPSESKYTDSLFQWPSNKYFTPWEREKHILSEAISPVQTQSEPTTLADQIFGRQAREQILHLQHEANLLAHRYEIHKRHILDINHRLMQIQESLCIEKMLSHGEASRHQRDLEKLLVTLESEQRDEETALWKDSLKIRQELLEGAKEYQASRHRADILRSLEAGYEDS